MLKKKYSLRDIAAVLRRSVSTISDEVRKNSVKGAYDPGKAHLKAYVRRHRASYRGKKVEAHPALKRFVEQNLLDGQSPEAIAGRLRYREKKLPRVSKNTIYSWEKGSIENANKVIRKFIPKGSDLSQHDGEEITAIEDFLNDRFMKGLKYATPKEALEKYRQRTRNKKTAGSRGND